VAAPAALAAPGVDLLPHRAFYDIKLKASRWGSGVSGLRGRMVVEFSDVCDGYTLNQRFVTEMSDTEGQTTVSDLSISSWESADGKNFRFNLKNEVDGKIASTFKGRAERAVGKIRYDAPQTKENDLPTEAIFPTEHAVDLILGARSGQTFVERKIFDGSGEGEVYDAYAVIGQEQARSKVEMLLASVPGGDAYKAQRVWPVIVSYFPVAGKEELPDYEVSYMLYENGISSDLVLDYGDFSVTGKLEKIEVLERPKC
jgi:hypothetical protein